MQQMEIDSIRVSLLNYQRVVILRAKESNRCLPIWIGPAEADSIAMRLRNEEVPRPMTHDLVQSIISSLGATVGRVIVSDLSNDTFYAKIIIQSNGSQIEIDSRPSDAIALAVRTDAPIFAADSVVEKAGVEMDEETGKPVSPSDAGQEARPMDEGELKRLSAFTEFVSTLDLDDLGQGEKPNPSQGTAETP